MRQAKLKFEKEGGVIPFDPNVPDPKERPRLSKQCKIVLDRLRSGPATNYDLAAIALKYSARISDIRRAGIAVQNFKRGSLSLFQLTPLCIECLSAHGHWDYRVASYRCRGCGRFMKPEDMGKATA